MIFIITTDTDTIKTGHHGEAESVIATLLARHWLSEGYDETDLSRDDVLNQAFLMLVRATENIDIALTVERGGISVRVES